MQTKRIITHRTENVDDSGIINVEIPVYQTIDDVLLVFRNGSAPATEAAIKTAIQSINLTMDGDNVVASNATDLIEFKKHLGTRLGTSSIPNVIGLNMARLMFKDTRLHNYFALGDKRADGSKNEPLQLNINCGADTAGVTSVEIQTIRRNFSSEIGSFIKLQTISAVSAGVGNTEIQTLSTDSNDAYLAVIANPLDGVIANGQFDVDSTSIYKKTSKSCADYIIQQRGYNTMGKSYVFSFADGSMSGILPMTGVSEINMNVDFTTAPTNNKFSLFTVSIKNVSKQFLDAVMSTSLVG